MKLTIALLQIEALGRDQEANLSKGDAFCRRASEMGADLALFPEMWNIGYGFYDADDPCDRTDWLAQAVTRHGDYVWHYRGLAQELQMAIAVTYLERWPKAPRNSVSIIDRTGKLLMTYAKVHTCDFDKEAALTPGDGLYTCTLSTAEGPVQLGAMICYDREFPESARALMLAGAEIIVTPNACDLEVHRLTQFRTRAYENMVGVAMANYPAPQANGHSVAYDGVAFGEEGSMDDLVVMAGRGEGVFLATFDLGRLRAYREHETWGNAFRKPSCYGNLTSSHVRPPFLRPSARR